ncbi:MAG: hypothetical protein QXT43_00420 [Candidatus Micrarchaeaceae archaeon]
MAGFEVSESVARLLGFRHIFESAQFCSGSNAAIVRGIKEMSLGAVKKQAGPSSLGVVAELDSRIEESALRYLAERGKLLVVNASSLTFARPGQLPMLIRRARWLYLHSVHAGLQISVATFAASKQALLSAAQLLRVAALLGAEPSDAKHMLERLGSLVV